MFLHQDVKDYAAIHTAVSADVIKAKEQIIHCDGMEQNVFV